MFSKDWDLELLNHKAALVIKGLENEGIASYFSVPGKNISVPASSNIEITDRILVVCSGYPEHAGVWSYTLLDKSLEEPQWFEKTSMEPYFRDLYDTDVGLIVLNPHAQELKQIPDKSLEIYLFQLQGIYEHICFKRREGAGIILLGFSLGGEVVLRFLQTYPRYVEFTRGLVLVDPVPPSIGKQDMSAELSELVNRALFYGVGESDGKAGELAEFTSKILKITPELFSCRYHGELPNRVWPRVLQALPAMYE